MSNNGPTFTKPTYDSKRTPRPASSPERRQSAEAEAARDSADRRLMATDPRAWLVKHGLLKKG